MVSGVIRLLIVEDESLFCEILQICLSSMPDLVVVDTVSDGEKAIEAADRLIPDVVLMDIELGSGIAAGRIIKKHYAQIGLIVLSAHKKREYLNLLSAEEYSG